MWFQMGDYCFPNHRRNYTISGGGGGRAAFLDPWPRTRRLRKYTRKYPRGGNFPFSRKIMPRMFKEGPTPSLFVTTSESLGTPSHKCRGACIWEYLSRRNLSTRGVFSPLIFGAGYFQGGVPGMTSAYVPRIDKKSPGSSLFTHNPPPQERILQNGLRPVIDELYLATRTRGGIRSHPVIIGRIIFRRRLFEDPFSGILLG